MEEKPEVAVGFLNHPQMDVLYGCNKTSNFGSRPYLHKQECMIAK